MSIFDIFKKNKKTDENTTTENVVSDNNINEDKEINENIKNTNDENKPKTDLGGTADVDDLEAARKKIFKTYSSTPERKMVENAIGSIKVDRKNNFSPNYQKLIDTYDEKMNMINNLLEKYNKLLTKVEDVLKNNSKMKGKDSFLINQFISSINSLSDLSSEYKTNLTLIKNSSDSGIQNEEAFEGLMNNSKDLIKLTKELEDRKSKISKYISDEEYI